MEEIVENRFYDRKTRLQKGIAIFKPFAKIIEVALPIVNWKKKVVKEATNPILLMSAVDLAEKIRKREIKSIDAVTAYIERNNEVNPLINGMLENRYDAAIEEARAADELILKLPEDEIREKYPLLGVPCTIKEQLKVKGLSFECGLKSRQGIKAEEDGAAVKTIRDAGAIILGVTNIPELCLSYETDHLRYGRCLNPYDTRRTPGGSSGGEGALITSAASAFGIGSDFFGSVRVPAAFCGLFGIRTTSTVINTTGVIPSSDHKDVQKLLSFGPMVRYAKDLRPLVKILSKEKAHLLKLDETVEIEKLNVFYVEEFLESVECVKFDVEIKEAINKAVNEFKRIGVNVQTVPKNINMDHLFEKCVARIYSLPRKPLIEYSDITKEPNLMRGIYKEMAKYFCCASNHTMTQIACEFFIRAKGIANKEQLEYFQKLVDKLEAQLERLLDDKNTILIFPVFPKTAFYHHGMMCYATGAQFVLVPSVMNFPSVVIPASLHSNGMPISFQVIAGRFNDHLCIAVAEYFENVFGGWIQPGSEKSASTGKKGTIKVV